MGPFYSLCRVGPDKVDTLTVFLHSIGPTDPCGPPPSTSPPGECLPQLCASSNEDVVLSILLRPGGPEAVSELLSQRDAGVPGQPGGPRHGVEQLPG